MKLMEYINNLEGILAKPSLGAVYSKDPKHSKTWRDHDAA